MRIFRISRDMDVAIEKVAKEKNVSVNTIVNVVLTKYIEWDVKARKDSFGAFPKLKPVDSRQYGDITNYVRFIDELLTGYKTFTADK